MRHADLFDFARRRHQIHLDKAAGKPRPWTDDPILDSFRFTNVFRELDATTVWFRENIRDPMNKSPRLSREVIFATIAFRWFNRIETGQILRGDSPIGDNLFHNWDTEAARARLEGVSPVVTAAYIIKTPNGMNKLDGVLWCIDQAASYTDRFCMARVKGNGVLSLERAWEMLCEYPYMGPFMAYEVITDLRHTWALDNAPDINTWANPGPGARRGLSRLMEKDKDHLRSTPGSDLQEMMQEILWRSRLSEFWPKEWPRWEMREVEHTLCEYDKWCRGHSGEGRPKQRYP